MPRDNMQPTAERSPNGRAALPWVEPSLPSGPLTDPQEAAKWSRFRYRHFTPSGCGVDVVVASGAASMAIVFARAESNADYGVSITLGWSSTYYVAIADKSTTGFTVHFGTAPGADSVLSWSTFRSED